MAKTRLPAVSVATVFSDTLRQVRQLEKQGFEGVVDVGVTFHKTAVRDSGWIGVVLGGEDQQSTTTVQLATRVHLGEDTAE